MTRLWKQHNPVCDRKYFSDGETCLKGASMITPTGLCRTTRTRWQVLTDYEFLLDQRVREKACQVLSQQAHASGKFVVFWGSLFLVWVMGECMLKAIMYLYYNNCDCYWFPGCNFHLLLVYKRDRNAQVLCGSFRFVHFDWFPSWIVVPWPLVEALSRL